MWSKRRLVINIKVTSSNNKNNILKSNLETKCKIQNHKKMIKRDEKQTHHEMFTQFGRTITYSRGERSICFTTNEFVTKRCKRMKRN